MLSFKYLNIFLTISVFFHLINCYATSVHFTLTLYIYSNPCCTNKTFFFQIFETSLIFYETDASEFVKKIKENVFVTCVRKSTMNKCLEVVIAISRMHRVG